MDEGESGPEEGDEAAADPQSAPDETSAAEEDADPDEPAQSTDDGSDDASASDDSETAENPPDATAEADDGEESTGGDDATGAAPEAEPDESDEATQVADAGLPPGESAPTPGDEEGASEPRAVDGGESSAPVAEAGPGEEMTVPGASRSTPSAPSPAPEPADSGIGTGAPDDREMPLKEHIEEMVKRLGVVIVVAAIVSAISFPLADRLINFLWYSFLPGVAEACPPPTEIAESPDQACPRLYHPLSLMLARLKVASLVGLVVALPVFVYQTYLFMRPGLYPNERRYYLAAVPTSLVLASVGLLFAYLLVLPVIFTYFLSYSLHAVDTIAFSLSQTFDLILLLMGLFAAVFQIPLFIMLAIMMGVTTREWLVDRRLYFWAGFLGVAFLFSPDPTGMAPFIVAITMVVLFEGTLLLLRWTGR